MNSPPGFVLPPDESRGSIINIVSWTGASLCTIFVALRIYTRIRITQSAGWDDILIVVGAILNILTVALTSVAIHYGLGRHIYFLTPDEITNSLKFSAIIQPLGVSSYCIPKFAVAVLIIRLLGLEKRGAYFLYSVIVILFITSGLPVIYLFAQCDPPDHFWHPMLPANCSPPYVLLRMTYVAGAWSAFTDVVLAVYPATMFWNLNMKRNQKIGLTIVMGLGFLASVAGIYKMTQLHNESDMDGSWALVGLVLSSNVETDVVIMCACAPILPKLFSTMLGKSQNMSASANTASKRTAHTGYSSFDKSKRSTRQGDDIELLTGP